MRRVHSSALGGEALPGGPWWTACWTAWCSLLVAVGPGALLNNELKERSLLLDMYKTVTKEVRDKVGLMAAEKKVRGELDEAR